MKTKEMVQAEIMRLNNNVKELTKNAEEAAAKSYSATLFYQAQILAKSDEILFLTQVFNQLLLEELQSKFADMLIEKGEPESLEECETEEEMQRFASRQADEAEHARDCEYGGGLGR